jgi:hypothetical protein
MPLHVGLWLNVECISSLYHNPPFYRIIRTDVAVRLVNEIILLPCQLVSVMVLSFPVGKYG